MVEEWYFGDGMLRVRGIIFMYSHGRT